MEMRHRTRRPAPARRRRPAFTLVELLVVIGIIALLISILLPSLNAARRQATRIACAANIRSIGQAYQLYANEYKGAYPAVQMWHWPNGHFGNPWYPAPAGTQAPSGRPDGPSLAWQLKMAPDYRIFYCPAQEEISWFEYEERKVQWDRLPDPNYNEIYTGYFMFAGYYPLHGQGDHPAIQGHKGKPMGTARSVRDNGDKVMATDVMIGRRPDWEYNWNNHLLGDGRKRPDNPDDNHYTVNFEGGNVLYNDGHAEWHQTSDTKIRNARGDWFDIIW